MSTNAISQTTRAFQKLVHQSLTVPGAPDDLIFIGPPAKGQVGDRIVSLFPFHLVPNPEMRNSERYSRNDDPDPRPRNALPMDIRYLISVFRPEGATEPSELERLGEIVAGIHANPTLGGALLPDQDVRLTAEPYPMEELSRIWGLFVSSSYVTSVVYLASPVFIEAGDVMRGVPIEERRLGFGQSAAPRNYRASAGLEGSP